MHVKATPSERFPRAPAYLVACLRMLVVDGILAPDRPQSIARVASLLRVEEPMAVAVLMELGRDGFLERVGNDRVRARSLAEMPDEEILQIRRLIEPPAIRAAGERARTVDIITLRHLADRVESALAKNDYGEFRRADDEFYAGLISLHPNAELARLCKELRQRTACDGLRVPVERGVLSEVMRCHQRVVDLIESGEFGDLEVLSLAVVDRLHFVGAPRMDAPYLVGPPLVLDPHVDEEFLEG